MLEAVMPVAGGLRYEHPKDMPEGMRERLALQILEKLRVQRRPAQEQRKKEEKELIYCKGKGGVCNMPCKNQACEHYDGTGAVAVPTLADTIRSMSNRKIAEAIMDLYLRLADPEFDMSDLWCCEENGCTEEERILYCDYDKQVKCIQRYLERYAEETV